MDKDKKAFIANFLKELKESNAAVFIGAGLSRQAGYVDWAGLMKPVAEGLDLDIQKESDLVALAQYHLNSNGGNRHQLNQLLIDQFSDLKDPTKNHVLLARLPIQTYWTTNYDQLIEQALKDNGKRVDAKYTKEHLATTRPGRDAIVYKMHGDIDHPSNAILSKDDYEKYYTTHAVFINSLSGDLVEKTFLFLGFSFTDPNLDFILSRIRTTFDKHQRQHYCIMKRRGKFSDETDDNFEYAKRKQELFTHDLIRFNIKTIFVDEFEEITSLLAHIESLYRRRTVFISGSAADYGKWGRAATEEFVSKLAGALISKNLRLTSGFGLGIGGAVVSGAVQEIYSTLHRSIDEQLMLRPFPIGITDPKERDATFRRYREELVSQAGTAIFVMGNKISDAGIINATGVRAEFELAKEKGLSLVPIGSSGWMSQELWNEVNTNLENLFPDATKIAPLFEAIGKEVDNPNELLEPLLKLIDHITKE